MIYLLHFDIGQSFSGYKQKVDEAQPVFLNARFTGIPFAADYSCKLM